MASGTPGGRSRLVLEFLGKLWFQQGRQACVCLMQLGQEHMEARPLPQAWHEAGAWTHVALFRPWRAVGKGTPGRGNNKLRMSQFAYQTTDDQRWAFWFHVLASWILPALKYIFWAVSPSSSFWESFPAFVPAVPCHSKSFLCSSSPGSDASSFRKPSLLGQGSGAFACVTGGRGFLAEKGWPDPGDCV